MSFNDLKYCCFAAMFLLGAETSFAQKHHIDLTDWGYKPRPNFRPVVQRYSQCISVGPGGRVAVGFVTRDRTGLATRALPPLSLHVIQFGSEGAFLRQDIVPTSSWDDNSILFTARGDLLVRSKRAAMRGSSREGTESQIVAAIEWLDPCVPASRPKKTQWCILREPV
jgi:hypothetical protein